MSDRQWTEITAGPRGEILKLRENEMITGTVAGYDLSRGIPSNFGDGHVGYVDIIPDGGSMSDPSTIPLDSRMLREKIAMLEPVEGQPIRVTNAGKSTSRRTGYEYIVWRVETDANWSPGKTPPTRPTRPAQPAPNPAATVTRIDTHPAGRDWSNPGESPF